MLAQHTQKIATLIANRSPVNQRRAWIGTGLAVLMLAFVFGDKDHEKSKTNGEKKIVESSATASSESNSMPPKVNIDTIAVSGAEPDRKKWEAASAVDARRWNNRKVSYRVQELKNIASILKDLPDRFASEKQVEEFKKKVNLHIGFFQKYPFNGSYQYQDAKEMICNRSRARQQ